MSIGGKNQKLGDYIRSRRESVGLDRRTCSERSGFDRSYWHKLEEGHYLAPSAKHLRVIAEVIGCPLDDLYSLVGYTPPEELPTIGPYLRAKYDLPAEATAQLESYFDFLRAQYGIPKGQRVFPLKPQAPKTTAPKAKAANRGQR